MMSEPSPSTDQPIARHLRAALRPRMLLASLLVNVVMIPVTIFVAALGVWVLEMSGGVARDTGITVAIAGAAVGDFWGGGLLAALTRAPARTTAAAWTFVRLIVLVLAALLVPRLLPVLVVQVVLAAIASWAGARVIRKQMALRHADADDRAALREEPAPQHKDVVSSPR